MTFYIGKSIDNLAEACSPEGMPEGIAEKYANNDTMAGIAELRQAVHDLSTITRYGEQVVGGGGDAKFVASIPAPALALALYHEPDLLFDKKKFYRWLNRTGYHISRRG